MKKSSKSSFIKLHALILEIKFYNIPLRETKQLHQQNHTVTSMLKYCDFHKLENNILNHKQIIPEKKIKLILNLSKC